MNMKTITMTLLLALSTLASARLGETESQCVERYGEVNSIGKDGERYFSKNGIFLTVRFNGEGKAIFLQYSNADGSDLQVSHAQILVEANGTGWVKDRVSKTLTCWDKSGYVAFLNKTGVLFVSTEREFGRMMDEQDKRKKELRAF